MVQHVVALVDVILIDVETIVIDDVVDVVVVNVVDDGTAQNRIETQKVKSRCNTS